MLFITSYANIAQSMGRARGRQGCKSHQSLHLPCKDYLNLCTFGFVVQSLCSQWAEQGDVMGAKAIKALTFHVRIISILVHLGLWFGHYAVNRQSKGRSWVQKPSRGHLACENCVKHHTIHIAFIFIISLLCGASVTQCVGSARGGHRCHHSFHNPYENYAFCHAFALQ